MSGNSNGWKFQWMETPIVVILCLPVLIMGHHLRIFQLTPWAQEGITTRTMRIIQYMAIQGVILLLIIRYYNQNKILIKLYQEVCRPRVWRWTIYLQTRHFQATSNLRLLHHPIILHQLESTDIHQIMVSHWHLYRREMSS